MAGSTIVSLRVRAGDDASCLNLYRPRQPRVLGVPPRFIDRDGFAWADKPRDAANPWQLLFARLPTNLRSVPGEGSGVRPGAGGEGQRDARGGAGDPGKEYGQLFARTCGAAWAKRSRSPTAAAGPLRLQVVALLADSIFQGDLLISEEAFLRHFPDISGYRFFLVETSGDVGASYAPYSTEQTAAVQRALERNLGDYGLSAETTGQRLAEFLTVQNTYLSTFQSLGGLGLLLGTLRAGGRAVAKRAGAPRASWPCCARPASAAGRWRGWFCWNTPCC